MLLHLVVVLLEHIRANGDFANIIGLHFLQPINDVVQLCLGQADKGVVHQNVRPQHQEGIRRVFQGRAQIRFRRAVFPQVRQPVTVGIHHLAANRRMRHVKTGAPDNHIHFMALTVSGDNRVAIHFHQAVGNQVGVIRLQGRVVIVGKQDALATQSKVRRYRLAQRLVTNLHTQQLLCRRADGLQHIGITQAKVDHIQRSGHRLAPATLNHRQRFDGALASVTQRQVRLGQYPGRSTLEYEQLFYLGLNLRHKLNRRGTGTDHRHPLSSQVVIMVPLGGMEHLAGETFQPGQRRNLGLCNRPGGKNHGPRQVLAVGRIQHPEVAVFVPGGAVQRRIEFNQPGDAKLGAHVFQVVENFRLLGEQMAPLAAQRKRIGIQRGRHITTTARVGIFPPGAAHTVCLLDDLEVVIAFPFQLDRCSNTGNAGTDDKGIMNFFCRRLARSGLGLFCSGHGYAPLLLTKR